MSRPDSVGLWHAVRMRLGVIVGVLLFVGCGASYSQRAVMPDGSVGHAIHCHKQVDCWSIAGRECPMGYDVVDQQGYTGQNSYAQANQSGGVATSHSTFTGDMLVKCKAPGATGSN